MEDKKISSNEKYKKEKTWFIGMRLNRNTDKEVIEYLESVPDKGITIQNEIKRIIKLYLKNN